MKKKIKNVYVYLKQVFTEFVEDDILKYSASLAYYTVFSLAPVLIVIISICGVLFGKEAIQGQVYGQMKGLVGGEAAIQVQDTIKNIHLTGHNIFATIISILVLLIGATGIFGEVQDSLNKIWGLRIKTRKTWWKLIINRLLSFSIIICIGFVMMVSLLLNAMVSAFGKFLARYFSEFSVIVVQITDSVLTFVITTFLFSLMFKMLPDAKIKWKDVLVGGLITSVFFTLGKLAIGYYLGSSNIASVYGAAGSIMIIMVWVYYSSIILYLGAEFTKVYAKLYGGKIFPNEYAIWIKTEETQVANPALKNKVLE
ncbi:MAG: YihY/virulence factor BrkB family protein [Chitinophagaceae bacterium]|nr:YihY/virulence factor BrkB family protein [Chitinophagaceae bacterium]